MLKRGKFSTMQALLALLAHSIYGMGNSALEEFMNSKESNVEIFFILKRHK